MAAEKMYSVLVLSGIALVGGACGGVIADVEGGAPDAEADDGTADHATTDAIVADVALPVDASEEFPSELPVMDAGQVDARPDTGADGFPVLGK